MNYGKYLYQLNKKAHEAKKHQKVIQVKEVKFRPMTDEHDYGFKKNNILRFLEEDKHKNKGTAPLEKLPPPTPQLSLFEADPRFRDIQELLSKIDINTISPVEALLKLNEILSILKK